MARVMSVSMKTTNAPTPRRAILADRGERGELQPDCALKTLMLTPNTANSIINRAELDRELQRIARRGYSTDNEEFLAGLVAIAVPIKNERDRTFVAVQRSAKPISAVAEHLAQYIAAEFARVEVYPGIELSRRC